MTGMSKLWARGRGEAVVLITLALLGQAVAAGAAALATRDIFGALAQSGRPDGVALSLIAISGAGIALCRVCARIWGEQMGQSHAMDIRTALYCHASQMSRHDAATRRAGAVSLRFVGDLTALRSWVSLGLPQFLAAVILVPATLTVLFLIDPAIGRVTLPLFAVATVVMASLGRGLGAVNHDLRRARGDIAADLPERMPNALFLFAAGRMRKELLVLEKRTRAVISSSLRSDRKAETLCAVPEVLAGLAAAMVIWMGFATGWRLGLSRAHLLR